LLLALSGLTEEKYVLKTLQFLIDHICADFTVSSLLGVVKTRLAEGPCTKNDIAAAIMQKDPSLDIRCAEGLAEGAVLFLTENGVIEAKDSRIYLISAVPK
jgi:hypothetical protein